MLPTPFTLTTEKRQNRSLIQDVTPFLNDIIFQYTNPLPIETEPHTVHTIPSAREHKLWNILYNHSPTKFYTFYTRCFSHIHAKTH